MTSTQISHYQKPAGSMLLGSVALLFSLGACSVAPPPQPALTCDPLDMTFGSGSPSEALYLERYERAAVAAQTGNVAVAYDFLAPVAGAEERKPLPRAETASFDASTLETTARYAEEMNSSAFIVVKDAEIQAAQYFGETDETTLLVSKSLAKPLSAIAVGRAITEGHIKSLDQKASDFITEWQGTEKDKILIRHLLDMRSGLRKQSPATSPEDVMRRAYLHPCHAEIIINEYPLDHEPGTRYDYSNANSELIAPLIERATGVRYEDWVSEQVLKPIGAPGGEIWLNRPEGTAHSGCCILLPAESWVRLSMLLLQDGAWNGEQILSKSYVAQMRAPTAQNQYAGIAHYIGKTFKEYRGVGNADTNMGMSFHSAPYLADDLVLFDGNSNQVVYFVPSQSLLIARLGARPPKDKTWDNAYLPNLLLQDLLEPSEETAP